jgi:hypothetical protein
MLGENRDTRGAEGQTMALQSGSTRKKDSDEAQKSRFGEK